MQAQLVLARVLHALLHILLHLPCLEQLASLNRILELMLLNQNLVPYHRAAVEFIKDLELEDWFVGGLNQLRLARRKLEFFVKVPLEL